MNRLQTELNRLYLGGLVFAQADAQDLSLADARGRVRAMVLEVAQPTGWDALSEVWHGVQMELELPAPGIAVSGRDGLQLWFSVETAIPASQAHEFLEALRVRFLAHVPAARVRLWPTAAQPPQHAALIPALQADSGNWSAFVAPRAGMDRVRGVRRGTRWFLLAHPQRCNAAGDALRGLGSAGRAHATAARRGAQDQGTGASAGPAAASGKAHPTRAKRGSGRASARGFA